MGFITIFQQQESLFVLSFKSDPKKCGNTENISKIGTAWPKIELIFHGVAVTFMLQ